MAGEREWDDDTIPAKVKISPHTGARGRRPCILKQTHGPGAPQVFILGDASQILGRSAEAALHIESGEISRRHLLFKRTGSEYSCTDLNSRNGVYLNGVKIHSAVLADGDSLQIGKIIFLYGKGD
ncbi:MAG TPA: FHA domain-containing protein [Myxococcota bacterium]|nr:FHA domain-containing protein [Myxococcota bacterium]